MTTADGDLLDRHPMMARGNVIRTAPNARPLRYTGLVLTRAGMGRWTAAAWCGHAHRAEASAQRCADALARDHNRRAALATP